MLTIFVWIAVVAFPVSEILLAVFKRARADVAMAADRGSMRVIWIVICVGVVAASLVQGVRIGRLGVSTTVLYPIALALLLTGLLIRWMAIITLGRLFTVDVAIHTGHAVVDTGLYRYVRHPSYAGLLLAFLGVGVVFGNWLSILVLVVPITFAVLNRIRQEEAALRAALGDAYTGYCRRTKRLVPGIL
jgi:protein-S-isoprenylcysteine O-methyltransferase Ste14